MFAATVAKSLKLSLIALAVFTTVSAAASPIKIGTVNVSSSIIGPGFSAGSASLTNNTNVAGTITAFQFVSPISGSLPLSVAWPAGSTQFGFAWFAPSSQTFDFIGTLSSLMFNVNGRGYIATSPNWASSVFAANANGQFGIFIDATPTIPEPSTFLFLGTGLIATLGVARNRISSR